jgi:cyclic pyranopterin phosphate synthase
MEALVACSAAALALDMVKAVERGATITDLRLESGGRSGDWARRSPPA